MNGIMLKYSLCQSVAIYWDDTSLHALCWPWHVCDCHARNQLTDAECVNMCTEAIRPSEPVQVFRCIGYCFRFVCGVPAL